MVIHNVKILVMLRKITILCLLISIPVSFFSIPINYILGVSLFGVLWTMTGLALLIFYILFSLLFWKCPYCKERLPMRFNIKDEEYINDIDAIYRCPYCNEKIL